MRQSFFATALYLTLTSTLVDARAYPGLQIRNANAESNAAPLSWLKRIVKKGDSLLPRQDAGICYQDDFYKFVNNSTFGEDFCRSFVQYPNTTVVVEYTPTRYGAQDSSWRAMANTPLAPSIPNTPPLSPQQRPPCERHLSPLSPPLSLLGLLNVILKSPLVPSSLKSTLTMSSPSLDGRRLSLLLPPSPMTATLPCQPPFLVLAAARLMAVTR